MYHVMVYTNIPDAVEYQEGKRDMDLEREVKVRSEMMEMV